MGSNVYRSYIDEVGNHDMEHVDDPNERLLGLTGVILESDHVRDVLIPDMAEIKARFFQDDPDEPVIFHRKAMVNKRRAFHVLRDGEKEKVFNRCLLNLLTKWQYRVATVVIDKLAHRDRYTVWRFEPYHYCLTVVLERFVLYLQEVDARGDVMVESRGGRMDRKLKDSYSNLYSSGTNFLGSPLLEERLTSRQLKVKPKSANICGLQLADLVAHPSRQEVLWDNDLISRKGPTFGQQICDILRRDKYLRDKKTGRIEGYGKKMLP